VERSRTPIKGVLFDLDGTLTRPGALDFRAIKSALGCPLDQPILEHMESQCPDRQRQLKRILEEKEEIGAECSVPNQGAERCIRRLRDRGFRLGILTRNTLASVNRVLEKFEHISVCDFSVLLTRETTMPKPRPDGVLQACRRMGICPSELAVVGDTGFDVLAGKAAGALTVWLSNSGEPQFSDVSMSPDFTITDLDNLIDILVSTGRDPTNIP